MMRNCTVGILFLFATAFVKFVQVSGLRCYVCEDCTEPLNLQECETKSCATIRDKGMISRRCSNESATRQCFESMGTSTCVCNQDGCNKNKNAKSHEVSIHLSCYQCHNCDKPINLRPCVGKNMVCTLMKMGSGKTKMFSRDCEKANARPPGCSKPFGVHTCTCKTNGCNNEVLERTTERKQLTTTTPAPPLLSVPEPIRTADVLRCYQCEHCLYPENLRDCKDSSYKTCITVTRYDKVIRECSKNTTVGCIDAPGGESCACNTNGCNNSSASSIKPNDVIMVTCMYVSMTLLLL